jgi:hypothetical protein
MERNTAKKLIYKNKPVADKSFEDEASVHYMAVIGKTAFNFVVPKSDMGDAEFLDVMESHLLLRWLL